jgi:hypothetical protein
LRRPLTVTGKSVDTEPCPVRISKSASIEAGRVTVTSPLPVRNSMSPVPSSRSIATSISPLPVETLTGPVLVET